jgi:glutaminase
MAAPQPLQDLTQAHLEDWATQAIASAASGKVAQRIPLLAKPDPRWLAIQIHTQGGQSYSFGETDRTFPLMSAIKPFLLLYLLEKFGLDTVFQWVGMIPSDQPFNSLNQLMSDRGKPRNPMINSGAIVLAGRLPGKTGMARCQTLYRWLNTQSGAHLQLDQAMLDSVRSAGREPNQALVHYLAETGHLAQPQVAIDTYEQICCLSGSVTDLARLGNLLIDPHGPIAPHHRQTVNAIMLTCGLYEASPTSAVKIGLPMKSGISGALVATIPKQGTIACYSPALDIVGNPIAGLHFVESLAHHLQLSLFV